MGWFNHQLTQPNLTNQLVAPTPGAKLPGPDGSRDMRRELEEWQRRRQNPTVGSGGRWSGKGWGFLKRNFSWCTPPNINIGNGKSPFLTGDNYIFKWFCFQSHVSFPGECTWIWVFGGWCFLVQSLACSITTVACSRNMLWFWTVSQHLKWDSLQIQS